MDPLAADLALQAILLGRGTDFVGGIDNEACLDFSQLTDFINSEGSQSNGTYFAQSLNTATINGELHNVIVENKGNTSGHALPESPPDSSRDPYSPQDTCEQPLTAPDNIYTTLGQNLYKPPLLNPMLADNLILSSQIMVADQNNDPQLLENASLLTNGRITVSDGRITVNDGRITVSDDLRPSGTSLLNTRLLSDGIPPETILLDHENNRQLILQNGDSNQNYATERSVFGKNENNNLVQHLGYSHSIDVPPIPPSNLDNGICEQNLESMQNVYTNLQNVSKKRKLSQDSLLVKSEPEHCPASQSSPSTTGSPVIDDDYSLEVSSSESQYQCIRFSPFQQNQWHALCDRNLTDVLVRQYRVDADKGFNFSNSDDAFVCQKKNHFQITCQLQLEGDPMYVKSPNGLLEVSSFHLHFYGVKHDCPNQTIKVEQSQSDRSKKPFHPVLVELLNSQITKVTVGRLHFSETTSNNMRKKGKPNPEQRYFQLVVGLHAHTTNGDFPVISHASQKIIVRASNPGQFESDVELCWQKGQTSDSVFHTGRVGINTDKPDDALVVNGNIKVTGHIIQPSDVRAKKNIVECNTSEQLKNLRRLPLVTYEYEPEFASHLNRSSKSTDTGVLAQDVMQIIPEAVSSAGDLILEDGTCIDNFLVVNKERIFMENIGAVKELCKVTDNLETRIDQLERINKRLSKLKRGDSLKSTSTVSSLKRSHSHKCLKHHHSCEREDELCSNKFIQIVIVILVLIMAFCLAAITTLYLMEAAARHSHFVPTNVDTATKTSVTQKSSTQRPHIRYTPRPYHTTTYQLETDIYSSIDSNLISSPSITKLEAIGSPTKCFNDEQDFKSTNHCPIYCCSPTPANPPEVKNTLYSEKKHSLSSNKTTPLLNTEKNKNRPIHYNNIDTKQTRQRRDTYLNDNTNTFDGIEKQNFQLKVQGRNFTVTLTDNYLMSSTNPHYYNYRVPISKYMADDYVQLIFNSTQANMKEVERCTNGYEIEKCPSMHFEDKPRLGLSVDENNPRIHSLGGVIFEVAMAEVQSKTMSYRASRGPNQHTCELLSGQLGIEYIEYNIYFYRQCDE